MEFQFLSMNTFYKISLLTLVISLVACQDPVDIDVPTGETELVISGQISDKDSCFVKISSTSDYFSNAGVNYISGARVSIWEDGKEMALLTESNARAGYYSNSFRGTVGKIYHIEVGVNGNYPASFIGDWVSTADTLRACPELDSLKQATLNRTTNPRAFLEGEYALMYFGDIPDTKNYLRIKRTLNDSAFARDIIIFDDFGVDGAYFGGNDFPPVSIYGPFEDSQLGEEPDTLSVSIESISADYEAFLTLVSSQQQVGSPFDAPPALVIGNIHRKNDVEDYAFGYFSVVGRNSNGLRYKP